MLKLKLDDFACVACLINVLQLAMKAFDIFALKKEAKKGKVKFKNKNSMFKTV